MPSLTSYRVTKLTDVCTNVDGELTEFTLSLLVNGSVDKKGNTWGKQMAGNVCKDVTLPEAQITKVKFTITGTSSRRNIVGLTLVTNDGAQTKVGKTSGVGTETWSKELPLEYTFIGFEAKMFGSGAKFSSWSYVV